MFFLFNYNKYSETSTEGHFETHIQKCQLHYKNLLYSILPSLPMQACTAFVKAGHTPKNNSNNNSI